MQLNNQLQAQIAILQNNKTSTPSENEPKVSGSPNFEVLDELIQRRITEVNLQSRLTFSTAKVPDSPFSKEIMKCEFSKKFSTPTFD